MADNLPVIKVSGDLIKKTAHDELASQLEKFQKKEVDIKKKYARESINDNMIYYFRSASETLTGVSTQQLKKLKNPQLKALAESLDKEVTKCIRNGRIAGSIVSLVVFGIVWSLGNPVVPTIMLAGVAWWAFFDCMTGYGYRRYFKYRKKFKTAYGKDELPLTLIKRSLR